MADRPRRDRDRARPQVAATIVGGRKLMLGNSRGRRPNLKRRRGHRRNIRITLSTPCIRGSLAAFGVFRTGLATVLNTP